MTDSLTGLSGETLFVTGGAGFIGSTFCRRMAARNRVVVFDTFGRDALAHQEGLAEHQNVTVRRGSVLDAADVDAAMDGATMVVHCAAIAGVDTVLGHPTRTMRVNVIGTYHVLEAAARRAGSLRRFVDFSTSEVYGTHAFDVRERDDTRVGAVGEARWSYAVSKLATEHMTWLWHRESGLPTVTLRPFNVYGPRQIGEGAIHRFVRQAIRGDALTVHNDGTQVRAWCYIDDMVDALELALVRDEAVGRSFNIGNPRSTVTVLQLAEMVARLAGGGRIERVGREAADVALRVPNITEARDRLGFEPRVELEDGLLRTVAWYRAHGGPP